MYIYSSIYVVGFQIVIRINLSDSGSEFISIETTHTNSDQGKHTKFQDDSWRSFEFRNFSDHLCPHTFA